MYGSVVRVNGRWIPSGVIAALGLCLLAACGGQTAAKQVADQTSSVTATRTAKSSGMTKEHAAKAYLAALLPYRGALFAFDTRVSHFLGVVGVGWRWW